MKKFYHPLLLLVVFLFISNLSFSQISNQGLVTRYTFAGNANDVSGNNNNGTIYNATLTTDRFGLPNNAYYFNGINAYIKASANGLPTTTRTVSFWFYANNVASRPTFIAYGGGTCGTSFFANYNTVPNKYSTSSHCDVNNVISGVTALPTGRWYHWAITTSSSGTKFYVNDTLICTSPVFYSNTFVSGKDLSLGVAVNYLGYAPYTDVNVGWLNGKLDDIRIYNRELSAAEIHALYNESPPEPTLISPVNNSIDVSNSPTLFWTGINGLTNYNVQVSTNSLFSNIVDSITVSTNQRTIPSGKLNPLSTYYWRVRGIYSVGYGQWSEIWNFTTGKTGKKKISQNIPSDIA